MRSLDRRIELETFRRRRLGLLGLLAVVCSQVALAQHQFQHEAAATADVCAACLQFEQFDVPHAAVSVPASSAPGGHSPPSFAGLTIPSAPASHYESRAPPRNP